MVSFFALFSKAQTLGEVLRENHVHANTLSSGELQQQITSFAKSAGANPFLLAYYKNVAGNLLPLTLHVLRYDPDSRRLLRVALKGERLPFQGFERISRQIPENCMGSALSISESGGVVAIDTHITPSAGCILVLDSSLKFKAVLWGWTLARLGSAVLYEGAMIHFAPIHAGALFIYDDQGKVIPLYPSPASDRARSLFTARLRRYLPSRRYCEERNLECDPTHFTTDFSHVHGSTSNDRIEVYVTMSPEGFGPAAQEHVNPETVHYVYARNAEGWRPILPQQH